jgi:predicted SnoaL-like aldol condensation-catalyzing enzyme
MTTTEAQNKAFVLEAFDTLFNKRDYAAAERFWSPAYIQHSAHIAPGREGLFELVKAAPKELHYENALIVADGDYVMLHGRFSGIGQPVNWVVVDILRIENGLLAEHWDVIHDEVTRESSKSGRPMFGDKLNLALAAILLLAPLVRHFVEEGCVDEAVKLADIHGVNAILKPLVLGLVPLGGRRAWCRSCQYQASVFS